jgi:SAM-dependent methyltransferase
MIKHTRSKDGVLRLRPRHGSGAALVLAAVVLLSSGQVYAQGSSDDAVWADFIAWFKSAAAPPAGNPPLGAYAAKLAKDGLSEEEAGRRIALIVKLFGEKPEAIEAHYDRVFSRPASGDPLKDGFASVPSAFLIESVKARRPGEALDVGTGQGRNAVWLATQGWAVTGMDVSGGGLAAARANAAKAGVSIRTEKAAYDDFDFGTGRWDLIVIAFAWAPVSDPAFVSRIEKSLRPGGLVVFEHFIDDEAHPYAPMVRALKPNELRLFFSGLDIEFYEEADGIGDWGGPGSRLVRMIARKRGPF